MTRDTTFTIHIETESGTDAIVASALDAPTTTPTPGSTEQRTIAFYRDDVPVEFVERYRQLWPLLDVNQSDAVRFGTSDDGTPWFRERLPDDAPVESLLVGVEPGEDIIDDRGFWGLLRSLDDQSDPVEETAGRREFAAEFFVLGPFGRFASHEEVREAFADEVLG